jgi:hypothetical protein
VHAGIVQFESQPRSEDHMSIRDVEQQALSAFLEASTAYMEEPRDRYDDRCDDLYEQATASEIIYVRELTRPLLNPAR